jgi:hypothetical protein
LILQLNEVVDNFILTLDITCKAKVSSHYSSFQQTFEIALANLRREYGSDKVKRECSQCLPQNSDIKTH